MFLEKLFESIYGKIWLIILLVAILALIVYLLVKNEKKEVLDKRNIEEENYKEDTINKTEENELAKEDSATVIEEKHIEEQIPDYGEFVIIKSDDGFFRVRKKGNERTIRKFATLIESENYIEKAINKNSVDNGNNNKSTRNNAVTKKDNKEKIPNYGEFVIIKSDDNFFRVRRRDNERTIRKFATIIEAENYIEKRKLKND